MHPRDSIDALIVALHSEVPIRGLRVISGLCESQLRRRLKRMGLHASRQAKTVFLGHEELPKYSLLDELQRRELRALWVQMRTEADPHDEHSHARSVVESASLTLPAVAIAHVLGLSESRVHQLQIEVDVVLTPHEGRALRKEFVHLAEPPLIEELSKSEQKRVSTIWRQLRAHDINPEKERQDKLIASLCNELPTALFAKLFRVSNSAIVQRRSAKGVALTESPITILWDFAKRETAPVYAALKPAEQALLGRLWKSAHAKYCADRKRALQAGLKALLSRLNARRKNCHKLDQGLRDVACSNPDCKHAWPKLKGFFTENWRSPDGLGGRCVVCAYLRNHSPRTRRNQRNGRLEGETRVQCEKIVDAYGALLPTQYLVELMGVSPEVLARLRRERNRRVSHSESRDLLFWWGMIEQMPKLPELPARELGVLRRIWEKHRHQFQRALRNDSKVLDHMRTKRQRMAKRWCNKTWLCCYGEHCRGEEIWPDHRIFFYSVKGRSPEADCCRACVNLSRRLQSAQVRFARLNRRFKRRFPK